jgi:hypothetical protein
LKPFRIESTIGQFLRPRLQNKLIARIVFDLFIRDRWRKLLSGCDWKLHENQVPLLVLTADPPPNCAIVMQDGLIDKQTIYCFPITPLQNWRTGIKCIATS